MVMDLTPLWISLKVASCATLLAFVSGTVVAAWMLNYRGRWRSLLEGLFVAPLVLPPTVVGLVLLMLLGRNGPLGALLAQFNVGVVFTWAGAVIAATVVAFPLMYRTALGAFQQIDPTLPQVARTLGASDRRVFWQVVLPLSTSGLIAGLTLSFARALGEFGATLMVAGNIPGRTQTLPMAVYFAVEANAMTEAMAWALVIVTLSLTVIMVTNRWQQRRVQSFKTGKSNDNRLGVNRRENLNRNRREHLNGNQQDSLPSPLATVEPPHLPEHLSKHLLAEPLTHAVQLPVSPGHSLAVQIRKQLRDFDLAVTVEGQQETIGVLGASGSGKSMMLRCIAGIETPDSGQLRINNRILFDSDRQINVPSCDRRVGLVFQNYALFPHLTVAENIGFGLHKCTRLDRQQRISVLINQFHLQGLGDRYPQQLSGGQQQRVALARAIATEPEVLLLDEPLSALDTFLRHRVEQQLIATLSSYAGVALFVTHNLEEAYRVCQNLVVMAGGRAIAKGHKERIFRDPGTFGVAQLTGCKNFSRAVRHSDHQLEAIDWNCRLTVEQPIPATLAWVGLRAHQVLFIDNPSPSATDPHTPNQNAANCFPCWLAATSETQHRVTLYLHLHQPAPATNIYHLQAEVFKDRWQSLKQQPLPWLVQLAPERLMLMNSESGEQNDADQNNLDQNAVARSKANFYAQSSP
ncbi:MAG: molybdate ABC transporter permease subunit [Cyanobacteria bacterium P01_H01_bin.121]